MYLFTAFGTWLEVQIANEYHGSYAKAVLYGVGDKCEYEIFRENFDLWVDDQSVEFKQFHVGITMQSDRPGYQLIFSKDMQQPRHPNCYWYRPLAAESAVTFKITAPDLNLLILDDNVDQATGYHPVLMHGRPYQLRNASMNGLVAAAIILRYADTKGPYKDLVYQAKLWKSCMKGSIITGKANGLGKILYNVSY